MSVGTQQDSHEFLIHVSDCLDQIEQRAHDEYVSELYAQGGMRDSCVSWLTRFFNSSTASTCISKAFSVEMSSQIEGQSCKTQTVTLEAFQVMSLHIGANSADVQSCLALMMDEEILTGDDKYKCSR